MCEDFAEKVMNLGHFVCSSCDPAQCRNHLNDMVMGCAWVIICFPSGFKATIWLVLA